MDNIPTTSTTTGFYSFLLIDKISTDEVNISIDNFLEPYINTIIENIKYMIDPNDAFDFVKETDNNNILININSRNPTTTTIPTTTTEQTFSGLTGTCRTADNKFPPWLSVTSTTFDTCKTRCLNDTKCSGYAFSPTTAGQPIKLGTVGNCELYDITNAPLPGTAVTGTKLTKADGNINFNCFIVDRTATTTTTTKVTTTRLSEEFNNSYFIIKIKFNMLYENSSSILTLANTNPMDLLKNIDYNPRPSIQTTSSQYITPTTSTEVTVPPEDTNNLIDSVNNKLVIVIVCIILLLLFGLVIYLVKRKKKSTVVVLNNTPTDTSTATSTATESP
jgi:hypothetical protein